MMIRDSGLLFWATLYICSVYAVVSQDDGNGVGFGLLNQRM